MNYSNGSQKVYLNCVGLIHFNIENVKRLMSLENEDRWFNLNFGDKKFPVQKNETMLNIESHHHED